MTTMASGGKFSPLYIQLKQIEKVVVKMEKKKIKLSTQKKLMLIPFLNFFIIWILTFVNLGYLSFKEFIKLFFRLFLVWMMFFPCTILLQHVNFSDVTSLIISITQMYLLTLAESWVLIQYQKKMVNEKEKVVAKMEKKQVKLSTQKKLVFIPFISFFIIYIFTSNNLEPRTFKERFNITFRVFLVTLINCPLFVLPMFLNFPQNLIFILEFAWFYVVSIEISLVLIKYQKKMGVK